MLDGRTNINTSYISPIRLKTVLDNMFVQFRGKRQQDAHELLVALLGELSNVSAKCAGVLSTSVTCPACLVKGEEKEELFTCLSLGMPTEPNGRSLKLSECLKNTFGEEKMDDDTWTCPSCMVTMKGAEQTTLLKELPGVLVLHLKRFTQSSKGAIKNGEAVLIPDWMKVQQSMYQLTAVVNHIGSSMNSGHYTADVKVGSNWKKCDDTIIRGGRKINSTCQLKRI